MDTATRRVVTHVPIDGYLGQVVAHPDGSRVYVTSYEPLDEPDAKVSLVDTATWTVAGSIALPDLAYGLALDTAGTRLYATSTKRFPYPDEMSGTFTAIDTRTSLVVASAPAPSGVGSVALHPDGRRGYASAGDKLVVFDTTTLDVTATVDVHNAADVVVHPSGARVYVLSFYNRRDLGRGAVTIVDADTNHVTAEVDVGHQPQGLAITPGGRALWVANGGDPFVSVVQLGRAPHEKKRLPMGRIPRPRRALTRVCRSVLAVAFLP